MVTVLLFIAQVPVKSRVQLPDLLDVAECAQIPFRPVAMESLPTNGGHGQSYGWVLYRKETGISGGVVKCEGRVRDRTQVSCTFGG